MGWFATYKDMTYLGHALTTLRSLLNNLMAAEAYKNRHRLLWPQRHKHTDKQTNSPIDRQKKEI